MRWGRTRVQKQVSNAGTSNHSPHNSWNIISCTCLWYPLLAHNSSYVLSANMAPDNFWGMMTSPKNIFCVAGPLWREIHLSLVHSPHKGQWRAALIFSLISARTNGCVNNRDADDLRRNRIHNDVTVMEWHTCFPSNREFILGPRLLTENNWY